MVAVSVLRFYPSMPIVLAAPLEWFSFHHAWFALAAEVLVLLLCVWIEQRLAILSSWQRRSGRAANDEFVSLIGTYAPNLQLKFTVASLISEFAGGRPISKSA